MKCGNERTGILLLMCSSCDVPGQTFPGIVIKQSSCFVAGEALLASLLNQRASSRPRLLGSQVGSHDHFRRAFSDGRHSRDSRRARVVQVSLPSAGNRVDAGVVE